MLYFCWNFHLSIIEWMDAMGGQMKNRAGEYRDNLSGEMAYRSFVPAQLPPIPLVELDDHCIHLLIQANRQIARLEGIVSRIPNLELFISMYIKKEALLSSQIEGTQATLDDIFDPLLDMNVNQNVAEVINYIKATEYSIKRLQEIPLCNRLIKEIHEVLMDGARGQEKPPGEFRYSQNWIGGQGCTLKNARFIPPNLEDMDIAMSDLEKYINEDDSSDPLVQAALMHYQFETIHPFLDGNGRVGRLLIILFLMQKGILSTPALYISRFLKQNRMEYYDRMMEVRVKGDYEQWIQFFLLAVMESSMEAIDTIDRLAVLHDEDIARLEASVPNRQMETVRKLFCHLEKNPIIEISKTADSLDLSYNAIARAVFILVDMGVLRQTKKIGRTRIYSYCSYLEILRKDT